MRRRHAFTSFALLALVAAMPASAQVQAYDPESLVEAEAGSMPVILAAPHDGTEAVPGVPPRDDGTTVRDVNSSVLARRAADFIEKKTGRRPYLVVARFSRKYIDANRAEHEAVESPGALPAYRAYHAHLAAFVDEVKAKFPGGAILIDVHGQGTTVDAVYRGTRGGLSVKALIARHGADAVAGDNSLLGLLEASGHRVFPARPALRETRFDGGNTVAAYGSHRPGGIDTIQLEFGKSLRDSTQAAEDFGNAILGFERAWLGPAR